MDPDPRRLLTFREVARQRSFSRAADALSLTQSAVSQQVAALERQLGLRLLDRGRGGLRLTPAGRTLVEHADALADRLQIAASQLSELAADQRRALRAGAFPSALATILPAAVSRLLAAQPDIDVDVREGSFAQLVAGVREGTLHVAVTFQDASAPRREHPGTERHDLLEEPMVLALPARHRLARRRRVGLAELASDTWIAPSRDGMIHRACLAAGFEPRIPFVTRDPLAIRAMVRAGLAVTLAPRMLAGELEGLRVVDLDGAAPRQAIYALLPDAGARELDRRFLEELAVAAVAAGAPAAAG